MLLIKHPTRLIRRTGTKENYPPKFSMTMPDHPSEQPITKALHNMKPTHESEHEICGWGIRSPTFTGSRSILLAMSRAKGSLILSTSLGRKEGKPFTETLMLPLGIAALVVDVTRSDGIPNSGREGGEVQKRAGDCRVSFYYLFILSAGHCAYYMQPFI